MELENALSKLFIQTKYTWYTATKYQYRTILGRFSNYLFPRGVTRGPTHSLPRLSLIFLIFVLSKPLRS